MIIPSAAMQTAEPDQHAPTPARPLPEAGVLQLLHTVFATRHPASWGRAAPSPLCWQAFAVYALTPEGSWRYDPYDDGLEHVADGDARSHVRLAATPVTLVCVADLDPHLAHTHAEEHGVCAGADASCIAEDVARYCHAAGLINVAHGPVTRTRLGRALGLPSSQRVVLAQSVSLQGGARQH
jgi:hypothetical protein